MLHNVYVQWNVHQKLSFACAYKKGVVGPNEIQKGGQIQNDVVYIYTCVQLQIVGVRFTYTLVHKYL